MRKPHPESSISSLTKEVTDAIKIHCGDAYQAYDKGDFKGALRLFYQAWLQLPKPQTNYPEAGWVLTGLGDTYFRLAQYQQACEALRSAEHCKGTRGNPFIQLRLGQSLYQLRQLPQARHHLHQAWRSGGETLFEAEADEYLNCISDLRV